MSQPPQNPDATPVPGQQTSSGWSAPDAGWPAPSAPPVPDWGAAPSWTQSAAVPAAPRAAAPPPGRRWVPVGAALAGLAAGAVGATLLVSAVFIGSAEGIGRSIGQEMAPALREGVREGMVEGSQESMDAVLGEEGAGGWYSGSTEDVEQFPPVAPGDLGPDATLDALAQDCFTGDLQACDDLLYESPPLSEYEEYAGTCGGRVKEFAVPVCTELG